MITIFGLHPPTNHKHELQRILAAIGHEIRTHSLTSVRKNAYVSTACGGIYVFLFSVFAYFFLNSNCTIHALL